MVKNEAFSFFNDVYGEGPPGHLVITVIGNDGAIGNFSYEAAAGLETAAGDIEDTATDNGLNIYYGVGLRRNKAEGSTRGSAGDVLAIPGLWHDTDIAGPGHSQQQLPANREEAISFINSALPLPPSKVVFTGGGLHAYWLFKEPWILEGEDWEAAADLLRRFQATINQKGRAEGWKLDNTSNLAQVLRVPGTFNNKGEPVQVAVMGGSGQRYNASDFEQYLIDVSFEKYVSAESSRDFPPADAEKIKEGCSWFKHAYEDAATLPEPDWYGALTIIACCEDAEALAHDFSSPYPGYSEAETAKKLQQAKEKTGPLTCAYIKESFAGYCDGCPQKVKSPAVLGLPKVKLKKPFGTYEAAPVDDALDNLAEAPEDAGARLEALRQIAGISSEVAREAYTARFKELTGVSVKAIRADIAALRCEAGEEDEDEDGKETQADILIKMATGGAYLFHDETKDAFASLEINGHRETWPLKSKFFKQWLVRQYFEEMDKSPNSEAIRQALGVIEAKAVFDGPEHKLSLRVAQHDGAFWYDLANDAWQAVKVTAAGWEVVDNPPVIFRRFKNTAPQVAPAKGGSLDLLRKYINLKNKNDFLLLNAINAVFLIPDIPHPVPIFYGDKGSAKTTAQRVIRKLIDPAYRDTMTLPTDKNELALTLTTNFSPCFDNLDGLKPWQSDMLCQAATGGGISKRELYSDMDEVILSFLRCPMLNGINLVASRDDLLDRSILFHLDRINEQARKEEAVFWQELEQDRPLILGALLDTVAKAMKLHKKIKLKKLPRMADFARWGVAATEATGTSGKLFLAAYYKNIAGAVEEAVLADTVSAAVIELMNFREDWEGTPTELLKLLSEMPGVDIKSKEWPKQPYVLTRRLNTMKTALADIGIEVITAHDGKKRVVTLKALNNKKMPLDALDASEPTGTVASDTNGIYTQYTPPVNAVSDSVSQEPTETVASNGNNATNGISNIFSETGDAHIKNDDDDLTQVVI